MKNTALLLVITAVILGAFLCLSKWQPVSVLADGENKVKIYEKDGFRVVESNGIPNHETGKFPNDGNPNRISEQNYNFKIPLTPAMAKEEDRQPQSGGRPWFFGVGLNGVPFEPGTAEAWNNDMRSGWNNEALTGKLNLGTDMNNAHVQPNGAYHYHGIPTGLVEKLAGKDAGKKMVLVGYAADGFPIYSQYGYTKSDVAKSGLKKLMVSYRLKKGTRPDGPKGAYDGTYYQDFEYVAGLGDLDEFNGRTGITPEYPNGTYYYVVTDSFPFMARQFKGVADSSFQKGPPEGGRGGQRPPRNGQRPPGRPF